MNILFVCGMNRLRSPTAELIFHGRSGCQCRSAGLSRDAEQFISADMIAWADAIFVMEEKHREKLNRMARSRLKGKKVVCLDIGDDYRHMDDRLIDLLWERVPKSVPRLQGQRQEDA